MAASSRCSWLGSDRRSAHDPSSPGVQVALEFETRLRLSHRAGTFLVLLVPLNQAHAAGARLRQRFDLLLRDFDPLFVAALRQASDGIGAAWDTVQLTRQLREAAKIIGIDLIDHVIVGTTEDDPLHVGYYSFRGAGML